MALKIVDKFLSGSDKPVELNVDYSNFENFVNFSSAEKRLKNFKLDIFFIGFILEKIEKLK